MNTLRLLKFALAASAALLAATLCAQDYNYRMETFEQEAWGTAATSVTATTGTWTTNKNVQSTEQACQGTYSLKLSNKAGFVSPRLADGAGTLFYYAWVQNREANVEVSSDGTNWTLVENFKANTQSWVRHVVEINDASVRYVRMSTTSNNQVYIDNLVVTRYDGSTADSSETTTPWRIPYFTQDFEDKSQYPAASAEATAEVAFQVPGQGEWRYKNAWCSTNADYIPDGSHCALRMLKSTSYVISPVLPQGVVKVSFNEGRTEKELNLYTSYDEGQTWQLASNILTDSYNEVLIADTKVNRIKLANEESKDADVDNICITAYPAGTPGTVATGTATEVTRTTARVSGQLVSPGDKTPMAWGICWAAEADPDYSYQTVTADAADFTVTLKDLPAGRTIRYRAFVIGLSGVGLGEIAQFTTEPPIAPSVESGKIVALEEGVDERLCYIQLSGTVTDNGGSVPGEVGVCFGQDNQPETTGRKVTARLVGNTFTAVIGLQPETTYYFKTYAINEAGSGYGELRTWTTGAKVLPTYAHHVYYVSPEGNDATADGSREHPYYNVQKAIDRVKAGDTIYMQAGTYRYTERLNAGAVGRQQSGMIALFALGGRAILDFSGMALGDNNQGMRLTGSYWHIYGIDICGAGDNGLLIERNKPSGGGYAQVKDSTHLGHHNVVENCRFYRNRDTGLQMKNLAENNMVINCDAYLNCDPDNGDADGFAVKISHGDGNYFYGCRAWDNSDDGWDGFIKTDGGFPDDITTTFEYCWAFHNGFLENGQASSGNGNGFKLGSEYGRNNVVLNRCLAYENLNKDFDQNHNRGSMILNNCSGYSAKSSSKGNYTYRFYEAVAASHEIRLTNCVAISDGNPDMKKSAYGVWQVNGTFVTSDMNCLPADFRSIDWQETLSDRAADGSLPEVAFMFPTEGNTRLIDKGTPVSPYEGESPVAVGITYAGEAPDLGCFETGTAVGIRMERVLEDGSCRLGLWQSAGGRVLVSVSGAAAREAFTLTLTDVSGRLLGGHRFHGSTTSIGLPSYEGLVVVRVQGTGMDEAQKIMLR